MAGYYPRVLYSTYTKSTSIEVFGENVKVDFTSPRDFFVAETDEIDLPEDLDPGDAKEEIFLALIKALVKAYELPKEEYVFFLDPYNEYMVSGIRKEYVPAEVQDLMQLAYEVTGNPYIKSSLELPYDCGEL